MLLALLGTGLFGMAFDFSGCGVFAVASIAVVPVGEVAAAPLMMADHKRRVRKERKAVRNSHQAMIRRWASK